MPLVLVSFFKYSSGKDKLNTSPHDLRPDSAAEPSSASLADQGNLSATLASLDGSIRTVVDDEFKDIEGPDTFDCPVCFETHKTADGVSNCNKNHPCCRGCVEQGAFRNGCPTCRGGPRGHINQAEFVAVHQYLSCMQSLYAMELEHLRRMIDLYRTAAESQDVPQVVEDVSKRKAAEFNFAYRAQQDECAELRGLLPRSLPHVPQVDDELVQAAVELTTEAELARDQFVDGLSSPRDIQPLN